MLKHDMQKKSGFKPNAGANMFKKSRVAMQMAMTEELISKKQKNKPSTFGSSQKSNTASSQNHPSFH